MGVSVGAWLLSQRVPNSGTSCRSAPPCSSARLAFTGPTLNSGRLTSSAAAASRAHRRGVLMPIHRLIPRDRTRLDVLGDVAAGRGIDRETAGEWLEAMYAGKAIGRLSNSGRPIVSVSADKGSF